MLSRLLRDDSQVGNQAFEYDPNGNRTRHQWHHAEPYLVDAASNRLLAEYTGGKWSSYLWLGGTPVGLVRDGQLYHLHHDHLGRPIVATDSAKTPGGWRRIDLPPTG